MTHPPRLLVRTLAVTLMTVTAILSVVSIILTIDPRCLEPSSRWR